MKPDFIKNFEIYELVPPRIHEELGEGAWWYWDEQVLRALQTLRDHLGSIIVNDWWWGGDFEQRGFRTWEFIFDRNFNGDCLQYSPQEAMIDYDAYWSMHKFWRAIDCHSPIYTPDEMRSWVYTHQDLVPGIVGVEDNVDWLHFDNRNAVGNDMAGRFYIF